jgi:hypothetical protein
METLIRDRIDSESPLQALWFPDEPLTQELVSPTPVEFRDAFATHVMPGHAVVSLEGPHDFYDAGDTGHALTALVEPAKRPTGYVFLDMDDTVADTGGSLGSLCHQIIPVSRRRDAHDYGDGMFFTNEAQDLKVRLFQMIREAEAGIQPVEGIQEIKKTKANWRAEGIYVGFISSQTTGSELPTIQNFLGRYFANNCDFLVIPGGHYLAADKGTAARQIMMKWGYDERTPVVGMDDIPGHAVNMRTALQALEPQPIIATIQPRLPSHIPRDRGSIPAGNSAKAFERATIFLAAALGKAVLDTKTLTIIN